MDERASRTPVRDWAQVVPGEAYDTDDVAALYGVGPATVNNWARAGKLKPLPRLSRRAPFRFLGATLLAMLGDQADTLTRPPGETPKEREARGQAAAKRVGELAVAKK